MRKLLVSLACLAAAIPAVALAADNSNAKVSGAGIPTATDKKIYAHQQSKRARRIAKRHAKARKATADGSQAAGGASPALEAIAACESGGDPHAIGGGGAFRGKYQFDRGTWASVGGSGDPAAASEAEQDRRAAILYSRSGASPWPVCGR